MFSKVTMFAAMALALGFSSAQPLVRVGQAVPFRPSGIPACGTPSAPNEFVAGVSQQIFETFGGDRGAICGRFITVTHNGTSVTAKVDNTGGAGTNDLILSQSAYSVLAPINVVPINVTWFVL